PPRPPLFPYTTLFRSRRTALRYALTAPVAAWASRALAAETNWPFFRGPTAGVADSPGLPDAWDAERNIAWSAPIPGRGWASPIRSEEHTSELQSPCNL